MSSIGRLRLFFTILVSCIAPAAFGQVVAKQGTPEPSPKAREVTTFGSPMILELPMGALLLEADGFEHYFKGLADYECEGVSVPQLKSIRSKSSKAKGTTLNLSSVVHGDQNAKRSIALQYEIVAENEVVLTKKLPSFELEPRYQKALETKIQLDPAAWQSSMPQPNRNSGSRSRLESTRVTR